MKDWSRFDYDAALAAGKTPTQISDYMAGDMGFDIAAARKAGKSEDAIFTALRTRATRQKPDIDLQGDEDYAAAARRQSAGRIGENLQRERESRSAPLAEINTYGVTPGGKTPEAKHGALTRQATQAAAGLGDIAIGPVQFLANLTGVGEDTMNSYVAGREAKLREMQAGGYLPKIQELVDSPEWQSLRRANPKMAQYAVDKLVENFSLTRAVSGALVPGVAGAKIAGKLAPALTTTGKGVFGKTAALASRHGAGAAAATAGSVLAPIEVTPDSAGYDEQMADRMKTNAIVGAMIPGAGTVVQAGASGKDALVRAGRAFIPKKAATDRLGEILKSTDSDAVLAAMREADPGMTMAEAIAKANTDTPRRFGSALVKFEDDVAMHPAGTDILHGAYARTADKTKRLADVETTSVRNAAQTEADAALSALGAAERGAAGDVAKAESDASRRVLRVKDIAQRGGESSRRLETKARQYEADADVALGGNPNMRSVDEGGRVVRAGPGQSEIGQEAVSKVEERIKMIRDERSKQVKKDWSDALSHANAEQDAGKSIHGTSAFKSAIKSIDDKLAEVSDSSPLYGQLKRMRDSLTTLRKANGDTDAVKTNFQSLENERRAIGDAAHGVPEFGYDAIPQQTAKDVYRLLSDSMIEFSPKMSSYIDNYRGFSDLMNSTGSKLGKAMTETTEGGYRNTDVAKIPGRMFASPEQFRTYLDATGNDTIGASELGRKWFANQLEGKSASQVRDVLSKNRELLDMIPEVRKEIEQTMLSPHAEKMAAAENARRVAESAKSRSLRVRDLAQTEKEAGRDAVAVAKEKGAQDVATAKGKLSAAEAKVKEADDYLKNLANDDAALQQAPARVREVVGLIKQAATKSAMGREARGVGGLDEGVPHAPSLFNKWVTLFNKTMNVVGHDIDSKAAKELAQIMVSSKNAEKVMEAIIKKNDRKNGGKRIRDLVIKHSSVTAPAAMSVTTGRSAPLPIDESEETQ